MNSVWGGPAGAKILSNKKQPFAVWIIAHLKSLENKGPTTRGVKHYDISWYNVTHVPSGGECTPDQHRLAPEVCAPASHLLLIFSKNKASYRNPPMTTGIHTII